MYIYIYISYLSYALDSYGPSGVLEGMSPFLSPSEALLKPFSTPQALEAFLRPSSGLLKAF